MKRPNKILIIAGSDTLSGGGIQVDIGVTNALGNLPFTVITSLVTMPGGDFYIYPTGKQILAEQFETMNSLVKIDAVKIGLMSDVDCVHQTAAYVEKLKKKGAKIVLDPVLAFKETDDELNHELKVAIINHLIPLADVVTPNLPEAEALLERRIESIDDVKDAVLALHEMGARNVVLKVAGRLVDEMSIDTFYDGAQFKLLQRPRLKKNNVNGAGCGLSTAIANNLANGLDYYDAFAEAKKYIYQTIKYADSTTNAIWPCFIKYED
ncbi:MAG: hydroxymethylpyrimidine/phosphomethylpyrimidine kinase [Lactobacillales bacterium]|jgi:pyridoxine kinase|nr:hydroxymethylpyrimidine/phosphomethylpyrimidine kinase [Lactobacillales bacterium]